MSAQRHPPRGRQVSRALRVERVYPHPRALLWRALTERELLARWLMPNDFEPRVGQRFTFHTEPGPGFDGVVHCEVLELVEANLLRISWRGGPIDTQVSFELTDAPDGTRLVVEQTGFHGLRAWIVARILALGNRTLYGERLPALLADLSHDQGGEARDPATDSKPHGGCMTREQSLWKRLLLLLPRRR